MDGSFLYSSVNPIENETDLGESVAGGLHKYANPSLIEQEKTIWKKAAVKNKSPIMDIGNALEFENQIP